MQADSQHTASPGPGVTRDPRRRTAYSRSTTAFSSNRSPSRRTSPTQRRRTPLRSSCRTRWDRARRAGRSPVQRQPRRRASVGRTGGRADSPRSERQRTHGCFCRPESPCTRWSPHAPADAPCGERPSCVASHGLRPGGSASAAERIRRPVPGGCPHHPSGELSQAEAFSSGPGGDRHRRGAARPPMRRRITASRRSR